MKAFFQMIHLTWCIIRLGKAGAPLIAKLKVATSEAREAAECLQAAQRLGNCDLIVQHTRKATTALFRLEDAMREIKGGKP